MCIRDRRKIRQRSSWPLQFRGELPLCRFAIPAEELPPDHVRCRCILELIQNLQGLVQASGSQLRVAVLRESSDREKIEGGVPEAEGIGGGCRAGGISP